MAASKKTELQKQTDKLAKERDDVLQLSLAVIPNSAYQAKNMYQVNGLGMYSGMYYVKQVIHTISADGGYSVMMEARKKEYPQNAASTKPTGKTAPTPNSNTTRNTRPKTKKVTTVSTLNGKVSIADIANGKVKPVMPKAGKYYG